MIYSVFKTGIIYPFIVYCTWSGSGFLTEMGYSDFAGSGIVRLRARDRINLVGVPPPLLFSGRTTLYFYRTIMGNGS